jgi:dCMP deaminase
MKTDFLIIGMTGPLGSGCSEISKFISTGLEQYKSNFKNKHLRKIDTYIAKYYRFLRENTIVHLDQEKAIESIGEKLFVEPKDFLDAFVTKKEESKKYEEISKRINRKLRQHLFAKKLMNCYCNTEWKKFTCISISTVIVKIIVDNSIDQDDNMSSSLKSYDSIKILSGAKEKLVSIARNHKELIAKYDNFISSKKYNDFDSKFCSDIDQYFIDLKSIKEEIISSKEVNECWLQDMGDNIRLTGNPFDEKKDLRFEHLESIAAETNKLIKFYRNREDKKERSLFVIDSFRNPAEVLYFNKRYSSFYLCSVYASKESRVERLKEFFVHKRESRDQGDGYSTKNLHKQNVPECVLLSDYALNNEINGKFKHKIARLLVLIDNPGTVYPTADEVFMNLSYSLSLRSTCLSRQVGAVITNTDGFVLTAGWNDVGSGQLGCSLNCKSDYTKYSGDDHLLSVWGSTIDELKNDGLLDGINDSDFFCFKDIKSKQIINQKIDKIFKELRAKTPSNPCMESFMMEVKNKLKEKLSIKRLEYARALHAEENALLQAARFGGNGVAGGTIYTTTFPCELCAKKIYQSHLKRIVYTEPYPDSISEKIFLKDGVRHINIDQFEGVKSPSFHKLFKPPVNIKEQQSIKHLSEK